jgi:hypothetical protein
LNAGCSFHLSPLTVTASVADLFEAYGTLRSMQATLGLAPFRIEDLCQAVHLQEPGPLITQTCLALMTALHEDDECWGRQFAVRKAFFRRFVWIVWFSHLVARGHRLTQGGQAVHTLHWALIDEFTWPAVLAELLKTVRCARLESVRICCSVDVLLGGAGFVLRILNHAQVIYFPSGAQAYAPGSVASRPSPSS